MRIHTDRLTRDDIYRAARIARVDLATFDNKGSRSKEHAFDVKLGGESRRRPNGGDSGAGSGYAATWDQWGVFLAVLFDIDPNMVTPYYANVWNFDSKTDYRFYPDDVASKRLAGEEPTWWPADAHGDHTFRFAGVPGLQSCTKCSANQFGR